MSATSERLLVDAMCGKLATYLRMCGYDAAYVLDRGGERGTDTDSGPASASESPSDAEIAAWAERSGRTLLTRDVDLAARVDGAVLLQSRDVVEQLETLYEAGFDLSLADPPCRCGACNGELRRVASEESLFDADASLPTGAPDPVETPCWRCRDCGQVFWKGSHWDDVAATLARVRK
ncbi:Mut7-C RNAse domain-containing protein [Halobellus rufus]|uniref:Mut7-C RNAse domain-containing protein n=1 Tax=Halobellus rufus TaxID=1448860 RepID=UPI000679532C|nr:Mut7-C RNAse domain-containing protein [Halobellus rufus]